jgi:hypothetical protein
VSIQVRPEDRVCVSLVLGPTPIEDYAGRGLRIRAAGIERPEGLAYPGRRMCQNFGFIPAFVIIGGLNQVRASGQEKSFARLLRTTPIVLILNG